MIRLTRLSPGLLVVSILMAVSAHAQDAPTVGITMAYPASFGVIWHTSEKIAIRPTITFGGTSSAAASDSTGVKSWSVGTSIGALFYVKKYDNVRTYFSPSYHYTHTSTKITPPTSIPSGVGPLNSTANTNGATGTFGAEYAPGSRVRLYGEVGFSYSHSKETSPGATGVGLTANAWGTTAGVGFVFYP